MSDHEAHAGVPTEHRNGAPTVVLVLFAVGCLVLLPFLPRLLSLLEHLTLGTNHTEDFCTQRGVHDELDALYKPIFRLLK